MKIFCTFSLHGAKCSHAKIKVTPMQTAIIITISPITMVHVSVLAAANELPIDFY